MRSLGALGLGAGTVGGVVVVVSVVPGGCFVAGWQKFNFCVVYKRRIEFSKKIVYRYPDRYPPVIRPLSARYPPVIRPIFARYPPDTRFMNVYPKFHCRRMPAMKFCFLVTRFNERLAKISSPANAGDEILLIGGVIL